MCGIAGFTTFDGPKYGPDQVIQSMMRVLGHRGPDGQGCYRDGGVMLGHRRLAILDLSEAGQQPMPYLQGRYWVTFNGEIYNFLELRQELVKKGDVIGVKEAMVRSAEKGMQSFDVALYQLYLDGKITLEEAIGNFDVVITTALVPGRPAPRLVTAAAVALIDRFRPAGLGDF